MLSQRIHRLFVLALLLATLSASSPAYAQDANAGSAELDEEARTLFTAGRQAFDRGAFDQALERFQEAYNLSQRPLLLFNIGTVLDRLRRDDEAIDTFRRFLTEFPNSPNARFARARVEALEAARAERGDPADEPEIQSPPPSTATATASSGSSESTASSSGSSPSSGGGDPMPGIALMAAGGALVLGTAGTIPWWINRADAVSECEDRGCTNGSTLAGERDAGLGLTVALGVAGLATLGVGVALFIMSGSDDAEGAEMSCAPGLGGLACAGRF